MVFRREGSTDALAVAPIQSGTYNRHSLSAIISFNSTGRNSKKFSEDFGVKFEWMMFMIPKPF